MKPVLALALLLLAGMGQWQAGAQGANDPYWMHHRKFDLQELEKATKGRAQTPQEIDLFAKAKAIDAELAKIDALEKLVVDKQDAKKNAAYEKAQIANLRTQLKPRLESEHRQIEAVKIAQSQRKVDEAKKAKP